MSESHDPMCSVPLSYLTMLQERGDAEKQYTLAWQPGETRDHTVIEGERARAVVDLDNALARIAAFEARAGCKLEQIPVEALGEAQNEKVMQDAVDTLKRENEALCKEVNRLSSALADAQHSKSAKVVPMVRDKATGKMRPRKKPGRKAG